MQLLAQIFHGEDSGTELDKLYDTFKDRVDYYIDGGRSKIGVSSTVVKIENNEIIVLREGSITKKDILEKISYGKN